MTTQNDPQTALAQIPPGAKFQIVERTSGRGRNVLNSKGEKEWTHDQFLKSIDNPKVIPRVPILLRPVVESDGKTKLSESRISLDLSLSQNSISVDNSQSTNPDGSEIMPSGFAANVHLQETVVSALVVNYQDANKEIWTLRDRVDELKDENTAQKIEIALLKAQLENAGHEDSMGQTLSKVFQKLMEGPGGAVIASAVVKNPMLAGAVSDAFKSVSP